MRAVLGIDAAWTAHNPSGVALAVEAETGWHIAVAASSYAGFGIVGEAGSIVQAAENVSKCSLSLVAVDMPLSYLPITGRRASDKKISSVYGARKCATHSPTAERPGLISDKLRTDFDLLGFPLLTHVVSSPGLAEVYPHPALVELTGASERIKYKVSRAGLYWPELTPAERKKQLLEVWKGIVGHLDVQVRGVAAALPQISSSSTGREMKAFEDTLDAIICCWIGICILEGRATAHGDENSAIWVPRGDMIRR